MTTPANISSPLAIVLIDPATGLPYAATGGGGVAISAGTNSQVTGTVVLSNSNGITFGMDPSGIITATVQPGAAAGIAAVQVSNTTYTSGTVVFSNANGISFGSSAGGAVTGSYTVPSTAGLISAVNVSAGTTSNNLSAITFSNANGLAFGLNASVVTGSYTVPTQTNQTVGLYASSQTYGQSSSSTVDARSLSVVASGDISVGLSAGSLLISGSTYPAQSNQSAIKGLGASNTGNTAGNTGLSTGIDWVIAGSNNITISESTAAGGPNTLWVSGGAGGAFSEGLSTLGNTSGNTGVTGTRVVWAGGNNITLSQATDANGATITVSGANAGGAQTGISSIAASGGTQTVGMVSFVNSNGITFGMSTGANTGTITASYTVPTVTNSSWTVSDSVTSATVGRLAFTASNGLTLTLSTSNNGNHTVIGSYTVPTQTNQTIGFYGSSQTTGSASSGTLDARSVSIIGAGIVSVGMHSTSAGGTTTGLVISATQSNQALSAANGSFAFQTASFSNVNNVSFVTAAGSAIQASYALNVSATGGTSNALSGLTFKDSNGVSFGLSTGAGVGTITATVAAQSNQTAGIYGSSQTVGQSSSSTYDARSLSIVGSGVVSVGWSNSSLIINAPAAGGDGVNVVSMATTTSGGATSGTTYSQSSGTIGLVAGSNITLQQSSNSIVIFGASGGAGGNMSLYANGNTTVSSSIGSIPPTSFSLGGYGAVSVGYSSTNTTGIGTVIVSAPVTSSLVGTSGIGVSSNGSTISVYEIPLSVYEPFIVATGTRYSSDAPASIYFNRFTVPEPLAVSYINMVGSFNAAAPSATSVASTGTLRWSLSRGVTIYSRQDYAGNSTNLTTVATGSWGITAGLSYSSTSQSLIVSYVTDSTGGTTSFNTTSNSSNWVSFLSGPRQIRIPMVTTLQAGEYFAAHNGSTTTGTTQSNVTLASLSIYQITVPTQSLQTLGGTGAAASIVAFGLGDGFASATTTNNTMPASAISTSASRMVLYSNFSNA